MIKQKKKRTFYDNLGVVKSYRIKQLGMEKGRLAERKEQNKLRAQELRLERDATEIRLKNEISKRQVDSSVHSEEVRALNAQFAEMRKIHGEQIKLFRKIYQSKSEQAEKLIALYQDKIADLDRRNFEINDFLSKHVAKMEQIKKQQELRVIDNTRDTRALDHVNKMHSDFSRLLSDKYGPAYNPSQTKGDHFN